MIAAQIGPEPAEQLPATFEGIERIVAGRDKAHRLWMELYDSFHAQTEAIGAASIAGLVPFLSAGTDRNERDEGLTEWFLQSGTRKKWVEGTRWGREQTDVQARDEFEAALVRRLDRCCWEVMMERLGFDKLLDRQAREDFHTGLQGQPPAFNLDNCKATFGDIWGNRREIYLRGIANVFMAMDRRFRSHDAFAIGNRLIIENALSEYGSWQTYNRRDTLADIERIFRELDDLPPVGFDGICSKLDVRRSQRPVRIEDQYFKVDAFKNGNVHLWFTNKRLLAKVNELLLEYYRPVEGDVSEDGPSYEAGPLFHQTPAKGYGFFPSPAPVVDAVIAKAGLESMAERSGRYRDDWTPLRVLEPSAGTGALASAARAKGHRVTCVEVQPHLAAGLCGLGFETREADFLKLSPADLGEFDVIVMNPPFDRGRDCDHVRHAFTFLRPGGRLVAVMSARAEFAEDRRHAALHDLIRQNGDPHGSPEWQFRNAWTDLPERSFAECGTNVNTVILTITRRAS